MVFFASVVTDDIQRIGEPGRLATKLRRSNLLPNAAVQTISRSAVQTLAASVARTASSGAPVIFV